MSAPQIKLLAAVLLMAVVFGTARTEAQTIAHYRFEDDPGFLQDSGPNDYDLVNPAGWAQVDTPFPSPVPQSGDPNAKAVATTLPPVAPVNYTAAVGTKLVTGSFTAEAFIRRQGLGNNYMNVIVMSADYAGFSFKGFTFMVQGYQYPQPGILKLLFVDTAGGGHGFWPPNTAAWQVTLDHDYYVAAVFEDNGATETVTFYQKDLTAGTAMITDTGGPDEGGGFEFPGWHELKIGSAGGAQNLDGVIDEVRISSGTLAESELLIAAPPIIPTGTMILFR